LKLSIFHTYLRTWCHA